MSEVHFRKPDFRSISLDGRTAVDMHFHTRYSVDSIASLRLLYKKAKKLGIGVAISDHNGIEGAREMWNHRKEIFVIPSIEISDVTGIHTLVYFYDFYELEEYFNRMIKPTLFKMPFYISKGFKYVLESTEDYNCYATIAHPFAPGSTNINNIKWTRKMVNSLSMVEAINSYNLRSRNIDAIEFAKKIDKGITAGSDGHSIGEFGSAVTIAEGDNQEDFLKSVFKKKAVLIGRESNFLQKAVQSVGKETTALRNNIRTHNQMNRMRSMFYLNKENIRCKIGNGKKKISKILWK